jgi:hypothetical protein
MELMRGLNRRAFRFAVCFPLDTEGFPLSGIDSETSDADSRRVVDNAGVIGDGLACFRGQE